MSNEAPNTLERRASEIRPIHRPRGLPENLWQELLDTETERRARGEHEHLPPHTPPRLSGRSPRRPTSILELARLNEVPEQREQREQSPPSPNSGRHREADYVLPSIGHSPWLSGTGGDNHNARFRPQASEIDTEQGAQRTSQESQDVREGAAQVESVLRTASEHLRLVEAARATIPRRSTIDLEPLPDESRQQFMERHRRATMHRIDRQQDFAARARQMRELRNSISTNAEITPILAPAASNFPAPITLTPTDSNVSSDRSTNAGARRDLDRALREYRIARRAFRTHLSDSSSPAEQNMPSYQGVMAQIAEQQSNNRNRMRARGQSRASILEERTDEAIGRIAAATGVNTNPWRSDDDIETPTPDTRHLEDPPSPTSNVNTRQLPESRTRSESIAIGGPYLGPTTTARGSVSIPGGMRDFYQRIEDRQRNLLRSSISVGTPVLPPARRAIPGAEPSVQNSDARNGEHGSQDTVTSHHDVVAEAEARAKEPLYQEVKEKARKTLRYLSDLKKFYDDHDRIITAVRDLEDSSITRSLATGNEVDLPLHINELPKPVLTSWLEAGMSWEGFQKGGFSKQERNAQSTTRDTNEPTSELNDDLEDRILRVRAWRHRESIRSGRQEQPEIPGGQNTQAQAEGESRGSIRGIPNDGETLADIERHLSDLLEENERRLNPSGTGNDEWRVSSVSFQPRPNATSMNTDKRIEDKWPVKVTLHDVDWEKMTIQGTMIASQILARATMQATKKKEEDGSSMETIFDGEIIDFRSHEMETVSDKSGYKVGGLMTDIKYWSRVGPFKDEIGKRVRAAAEKKALVVYEQLGLTGTVSEQKEEYKRIFKDSKHAGDLDREEIGSIVYGAMAELLGSRKWLEKTMGEEGWIFMRWKERCFVTNSSVQQHSSTTAIVNGPSNDSPNPSQPTTTTTTSDMNVNTNDHPPERTAWGLTIRGFYYVVLNRTSGKIDALYFDAGSHPYQELSCTPVGTRRADWKSNEGPMGEKDAGCTAKEDDLAKFMAGLVVRSTFGSFQFR